MDKFVKQYIVSAIWAEGDESTDHILPEECSPEFIEQAEKDCKEFLRANEVIVNTLVENHNCELSTIAHDFWMTRNGHGVGFWDGDYPQKLGDELTEYCKKVGECTIIFNEGTVEIL